MVAGYDSITSIDYQLASARAWDAQRERDAAVAELELVKGNDRDETRRLLYMALYASRTDRYNLVGTLVNALAHHGSGLDPDEAGEHVLEAVNGGDQTWVRAQIARLTEAMATPSGDADLDRDLEP